MPSWLIKAAIQGLLSQLPASHHLNELLQRAAGSLQLTEERFAEKYALAMRHFQALEDHGVIAPNGRVLEIGTGWHPIVPVAFALHGAGEVFTIDIRDHLRTNGVLAVLEAFHARRDALGDSWIPGRAERLIDARYESTPAGMLKTVGVQRLLGRVEDASLNDRSVRAVISNNTLEHVPADQLLSLLKSSRRLIEPGGAASHWIDLRDHYANFDPSLSVHNFLSFDERRWRPFNNALQFHNRLRAPAFRNAFEAAGWEIIHEEATRTALANARLAEPFVNIPRDELEITELHLVVRPAR